MFLRSGIRETRGWGKILAAKNKKFYSEFGNFIYFRLEEDFRNFFELIILN